MIDEAREWCKQSRYAVTGPDGSGTYRAFVWLTWCVSEIERLRTRCSYLEGQTHYKCTDCGPHVMADEDGCCTSCGADCLEEQCLCIATGAQGAEIERLRESNERLLAQRDGMMRFGAEQRDEADRLRSLLGQRCEECGHWGNTEPPDEAQKCRCTGPHWLHADGETIYTYPFGGAGCDNFKRSKT